MARITGSFSEINFGKVEDAIRERMREALKVGVLAWLATADSIIPVWSGASRATLSKLAAKVDYPLPLFHVERAPNRISLGKRSGYIKYADKLRTKVYFEWTTSLEHLIANDAEDMTKYGFNLIRPGPYHVHKHAGDAFFFASNRIVRRISKTIRENIKITRRKIDG